MEEFSPEEIAEAKTENLRARLRGCASLAKELDLEEVETYILRILSLLTRG